MLLNFITFFLQISVEDKIKNAPDKGYEIGLVIGTYLPFILLAALAYFIYYKAKNRKDFDD